MSAKFPRGGGGANPFSAIRLVCVCVTGALHECSCLLNLGTTLTDHLLLFRNEFNKFINTGARMFDSFYHMTNRILACKTSISYYL